MHPPIKKKPVPPMHSTADIKGKAREVQQQQAFERLPEEIIRQILETADANTFDSLTLLNSRWHQSSRSTLLYTHHLRSCGATPPAGADLLELVRAFAGLARRELFASVLRPQVHEIRLESRATASAAAFPGGEAFRFEFSAPTGRQLLALSSSRIFVLDLSGGPGEVCVRRELKISRRPVSVAVLDDGSVLAVLSSNSRVTLYDLRGESVRYIRSFLLDNEPRAIALSPGAEVLGAAFDGGIEVYSLRSADRRSVQCDSVDALAFSRDGTMLLGTTLSTAAPTTVLVSAQHFSTDMPVEGLAALWTTQVLFPRSSRDSSHAALLPAAGSDDVAWTFAHDRVYEMFRAVRVEDLRNGHTYFTGPNDAGAHVIPPATLPAASEDGSMVAAGFTGGRIWVYGIPGRLDLPAPAPTSAAPSGATTPERTPSTASRRLPVPHWQVLSERPRNAFIHGSPLGAVPGLCALRFIAPRTLVAVGGGGIDGGGGRILVYTFTRGPRAGSRATTALECGGGGECEALPEDTPDIEVEVDIARRRTVRISRARPTIPPSLPPDLPYSQAAPRTPAPAPAVPAVPAIPHARYARAVAPGGVPLPPLATAPPDWAAPPPPYSPRSANPAPLPAHLVWSMQGPVRHPAPPPPPETPPPAPAPALAPAPDLDRARSTLGRLMRRRPSSATAPTSPVSPVRESHAPVRRGSASDILSRAAPTPGVATVRSMPMSMPYGEHYQPALQHQQGYPHYPHYPTQTQHTQHTQPQHYPTQPAQTPHYPPADPYPTNPAPPTRRPPPPQPPSQPHHQHRRSGSVVRRRPSRAERSAARNVLDARRRREEARRSGGAEAEGAGTGGKKKHGVGGGSCVLM